MSMILLLLRILFGAFFIWSGIAKVKDPIEFAEAVRNFDLIGDPLAPAMALFIPWVEVIAGIAIMWDKFAKGGSGILTGSLAVFTGAIIIAWARGLDITCGCFGGTEELNYPVKVAQNLGLLLLGGFLFYVTERTSQPIEPKIKGSG